MSESSEGNPMEPYVSGSDRYIRFAEDILGLQMSTVQKRLLRAVTEHQRVAVVGANGAGKSYAIATLNLAWVLTNPNSIGIMTSGSYQILEETVFKSMRALLENGRDRGFPLPGELKKAPPRLEFEDNPERYWKAISGRYPENLEGRHSDRVQVVIDECDKPDISAQHFDSALSSITDSRDRCVAIGNPPKDESNSFYDLLTSDRWHVVHFSSLESHNVQRDAGNIDGDRIPGLVDLEQVKSDFNAWHPDTEFPGIEASLDMIEYDDETGLPTANVDGLDDRWYRRRLGVIPPDGSQAVRPFSVDDVVEAEQRWDGINPDYTPDYNAFGVDIARGGGDRTVIVGVTNSRADILADRESPGDHRVNKRLVKEALGDTTAPVVIDAVGEGSGVADELSSTYNVTRFKGGSRASERQKYYDKRSEALGKLGEWLSNGAIESNSNVASELRSASRHIEFSEKSTRNDYSWIATSKSELKKSDRMGRSPDLLDAMSIGIWALSIQQNTSNPGYASYSY